MFILAVGAIFRAIIGWFLRIAGKLFKFVWREFWANIGIIIGYGIVGVLGIGLTMFMLWPSYKDPSSRMYTSGMGYGAMKRRMGLPFETTGARVKRRDIVIPYLGEGLVTGLPTRLAIIPMGMIKKVHVGEGDHVKKGQLLLEIDELEAKRKLSSAQLSLRSAKAELRRVEVGSTVILAQERPEHDRLKVDDAQKQLAILQQEVTTKQNMVDRGLLARSEVLDTKRRYQEIKAKLEQAQFFANVSEQGAEYSVEIARNAVIDAEAAVGFREAELLNYKLYAPADGLISAVLVREGEFNSDMGKPAFLLSQGLWFEGYFDQAVLSRLKIGQDAEVFLEAHPGELLKGKVTKIIPEVVFASGGPEIARPLRPRGTGAPEWSATFRVQFQFVGMVNNRIGDANVALGMTGNVKILTKCSALTVPRNAVLSIAASRALVTQPLKTELGVAFTEWTMNPIKLGYVGHDWAEVASGLVEGDIVLIKGHRIIREGDAIQLDEIVD